MPLLGAFIVELAEELTRCLPPFTFLADFEFPVVMSSGKAGAKPACDGAVAVIQAVGDTKKQQPLLLFEYKPVIDQRVERVDPHALLEVLLQGFYCLQQYKLRTVLHCLTDLSHWFYFKLEHVEHAAKMKIAWYRSLAQTQLQLEEHVCFLQPVVSDLLTQRAQPKLGSLMFMSVRHPCVATDRLAKKRDMGVISPSRL